MKNLVLASLIALTASQAAGCIITSGDDTEDAYISATWTLRSEATNSTATCPPGFDTAALYNQALDGGPCDSTGATTCIDLFPCSAGQGTSAPLLPAEYTTWIEIANTNNTQQYAQSLSAVVDVTTSDKTFNTQILVDGGYFQFAWDLRGASTNAALSCAQAGVDGGRPAGIQLQAFISGSNQSNADIFDCEDGSGITAGYVAGSYEVLIDAIDPNPVGSAPTIDSSIQMPNKVTNLGTVTIPITGL